MFLFFVKLAKYTPIAQNIYDHHHCKMAATSTKPDTPSSVDEYILAFPPNVQKALADLRRAVAEAAPGASEAIKYGMPTFVLEGNLVHFAAFKNHIGFYSVPTGEPAFTEDFAPYKTANGSIQFPLNKPMPLALVRKIVAYRVEENRRKNS